MSNDYQGTEANAQTFKAAQASQQAQPPISQGKAKGRKAIAQQTAMKRTLALELLKANKTLLEIAKALGYDRRSKATQFFQRHGIKVSRQFLNEGKAKRADNSEDDPSGLTHDQIQRASQLGITPGRFANLLKCERGTSSFSHPQPGVVYTKNVL